MRILLRSFAVTATLLISLMVAGEVVAASGELPGQDGMKDMKSKIQSTPGMDEIPGFMDGPDPENDLVYLMLRRLLGDPVVNALGYFDRPTGAKVGGVTAIGAMLGLMPYLALFISSLFMAFLFFAGMFSTATTGELLGRKWDTWAVPVRTAMAYTLLIPAPAYAPFSGIMMIVLGLILLSIGAASAYFTQVVGFVMERPLIEVLNDNSVTMSGDSQWSVNGKSVEYGFEMGGHSMVEQLALADMCLWISANHELIKPREQARLFNPPQGKSFGRYEFGPDGGVCGSFVLTYSDPSEKSQLSEKVSTDIRNNIRAAVPGIITRALGDIRSKITVPIVEGGDNPAIVSQVASAINEIRNTTNSALFSAATASSKGGGGENVKKYKKELSKFGFGSAGLVYWSLERQQEAFVDGLLNAFPEVQNSKLYGYSNPAGNELRAKAYVLVQAIEAFERTHTPRGQIDAMRQTTSPNNAAEDILSTITTYIMTAATGSARMGSALSASNPNPMMEIKMLGQQLQGAIVVIYTGRWLLDKLGWAGKAINSVMDKFGSDDGGSSGGLTGLASMVMTFVVAVAFTYANVIPAMPYVLWVIGIIGYVTYAMEALIGCNFWMAMYSHPDGEGLIGKGGAGYPILLTLVMYPILMVTGLLLGMGIIQSVGWFVNLGLWSFLEDMNADGFNVFSMIGGLATFAIVNLVLVYKSFSLIYELPQTVLHYMGVSAHFNLGSEAGRGEGMATSAGSRITGALGTAMGRAA